MLSNMPISIRRQRAVLERNRVELLSMLEDARIADAFDEFPDSFFSEGVSEKDIEELINAIPESDDEDEQVDRILSSPTGMSIDDIYGIDSKELKYADEIEDLADVELEGE